MKDGHNSISTAFTQEGLHTAAKFFVDIEQSEHKEGWFLMKLWTVELRLQGESHSSLWFDALE